MVSQGECKLIDIKKTKKLPHFSWRITWDKITGMTTQDYWSRALQSPAKIKARSQRGCTQADAATLVPVHPGAFLSHCHQ